MEPLVHKEAFSFRMKSLQVIPTKGLRQESIPIGIQHLLLLG